MEYSDDYQFIIQVKIKKKSCFDQINQISKIKIKFFNNLIKILQKIILISQTKINYKLIQQQKNTQILYNKKHVWIIQLLYTCDHRQKSFRLYKFNQFINLSTARKQPQFKLGWNVTDQTNQYQIRNSKNKKQITGKITQDKSLPKNTAHYNYDYKPYNNNINKNDNTSLLRNDDIYKQFNNKSKYEEEPEEIRRKNESEYLRQQYEKLQGEQKAYYQNQMKNPYEENNQYNDFNSLPINHQNLNEKNQQNRQYINQNNYEQIPQPNEYQNARNDIENLPMSHSNDHNYQNSPYDYSHNQYVKQLQLQEYENYKRALERQDKALKNQQQKFENKKPSEKNINPYSHQQGYQIQQPTHQHQPNSFNRNSENNSYQNQQEELQKIMASYDQKKGMINEKKFTPSENSKYQKRVSSNSFNSGTGTQIKAERRTLLKPKQSIRDVIFNGMGVGEPIIPQRNAAKRVNSNMILGGDNYAFASHK